MSLDVSKLVWLYSKSRLSDRLVLLALADMAQDDARAYPSMRTLSQRTGLSERTIQTSVKNLQKLNEIEVIANEGPRGTNIYIITIAVALPENPAPPPQTLHPANNSTATGNLQHGYRKSTALLPENPAPKRSLTINKRSRTIVAFSDLKVPDSLKTVEFEAAWNIWAEYRKQRGLCPYVEAGANVQLAKLGKIGSSRAIAAIEHSMAQNYQGIYEGKQTGTNANNGANTPISTANNNLNRDAIAGYRAHSEKLALGLRDGGQGDTSGATNT